MRAEREHTEELPMLEARNPSDLDGRAGCFSTFTFYLDANRDMVKNDFIFQSFLRCYGQQDLYKCF